MRDGISTTYYTILFPIPEVLKQYVRQNLSVYFAGTNLLNVYKGSVYPRLRWSRGSALAFGTQVRGFKPGPSRRIFQGEKKSSARLPSERK